MLDLVKQNYTIEILTLKKELNKRFDLKKIFGNDDSIWRVFDGLINTEYGNNSFEHLDRSDIEFALEDHTDEDGQKTFFDGWCEGNNLVCEELLKMMDNGEIPEDFYLLIWW